MDAAFSSKTTWVSLSDAEVEDIVIQTNGDVWEAIEVVMLELRKLNESR